MTWQPPPGLTVETIHPRGDGAVEVAIATLAPGAVVPWDSHAFTERLRVLGGGVCVTIEREHGERVPVDLGLDGRVEFDIAPAVRHEVVNWNRREPATLLVVMVHQTEDDRSAYARALDGVGEALRREAEAFDEDVADAIVTAGNLAIDSLRSS